MALLLEVAGRSDVGCVREDNEDNFGYDIRRGIFVVCDGMGGQAAGEVASKIAVDTLLGYFREGSAKASGLPLIKASEHVSEHAKTLGHAIHLANNAIRDAASRYEDQ